MLKKPLKTLFIILIIAFLGTGIYFSGYLSNQNSGQGFAAGNTEAGKVIDAEKNYVEPGKNNRMMIMELGATTCIPCKMMTPILEELAKEQKGKLDVQFVDVYKRGDLAQKFKIMSIPTQIFFNAKGKELFRHIGFYPKAEIMKKLKELGFK